MGYIYIPPSAVCPAPSQSVEADCCGHMAARSCPSSPRRCTLLACCLALVLPDVTRAVTPSLWTSVGQGIVTSSARVISTSASPVGCVTECEHQGQSCGFAAFDWTSGLCFLQPSFRPTRPGDTGPLIPVFSRETVTKCLPSEAPDVSNAHVTQWRMTSSALEGDVSCDEDYILSADVTSQVRCPWSSGVWSTLMTAPCRQFSWRNYTVKLYPAVTPLPRPAQVGLCVRVKGTPTLNYRFSINLEPSSNGDFILHINPRLETWGEYVNTTIINYKLGGRWGARIVLRDPSPPFPFAVGVPFTMVITAVSLYTFSVQVNGVQYAVFTGPQPVSAVTQVSALGDVSLEELVIDCYS